MEPRMTAAAWQRGLKNAVICGAGVLALISLLTYVISTLSGRSFRDSGAVAFSVLWGTLFVAFVVGLVMGYRNRGTVLLDCGQHPARALFLLNAVIFFFIGLGGVFRGGFDMFGIAGGVFGITFSVYWILMSCGRLQIVEKGVWQYWSLLKWEKLESYEWRGTQSPTLMLQAKSRLPFASRGAIPVPAEHRAAMAALLEQHLAAPAG